MLSFGGEELPSPGSVPEGDGPRSLETSDENLLRLHLAGEPTALSDLIERHQPWVFRYLRQRVGADDAVDLAQEVFVRVARAAPKFGFKARFSTWLFSITRNVATNHLSRHRRHRFVDDLRAFVGRWRSSDAVGDDAPAVTLEAVPDERPQAERLTLAREELGRLRVAIGELPEAQQDVLLLVGVEGLSLDEVSRRLSLNLNTVKTRLRRARLRVAEVLAEEGGRS
ncbi:MAG: RNA polymerase sigma factor [Acidobacteriota bacterium]